MAQGCADRSRRLFLVKDCWFFYFYFLAPVHVVWCFLVFFGVFFVVGYNTHATGPFATVQV